MRDSFTAIAETGSHSSDSTQVGEVLDLSSARLPEPVPLPFTLNNIVRCMEEHEEIRNFIPIYISVSAKDIEPKSETLCMALIDGSIESLKAMPRRKRKTFGDGEYKDTGTKIPATALSVQNYIDSFWLGTWPSGQWLDARVYRLPWQRKKMTRTEACHIVPIDTAAIEKEAELNHPHFSGEILFYPISVPNFDYTSTEFDFRTSDEIVSHLGFRRPAKHEILIMRVLFAVFTVVMIGAVFFIGEYEVQLEGFLEQVLGYFGFNSP